MTGEEKLYQAYYQAEKSYKKSRLCQKKTSNHG